MKFICGPLHDRREIILELPTTPITIGVLVSGGIDSAILLHLIYQQNELMGNIHKIIPLTVARKEGSKYFACYVVRQVQQHFNLQYEPPFCVGDNTVFEPKQVTTGMAHAVDLGCDLLFLGVIEQREEHALHWNRIFVHDTLLCRFPFSKVQKSHVIDLVRLAKQEALFHITHSCDEEVGKCGQCNGCRERAWGFSQLEMEDPGKL